MKKIIMLLMISIGLLFGTINESNAFGFGFCDSACNKASCIHKDVMVKCANKCKKSEIKNCTTSFCKYGCTAKNCKDKATYLFCHKICTGDNKTNITNCKEATGKDNRNAGRQESKARNEALRAKKAAKAAKAPPPPPAEEENPAEEEEHKEEAAAEEAGETPPDE